MKPFLNICVQFFMKFIFLTLYFFSIYSISEETKIRCIKDPLCSWSWFDDDCYCERNPCDTLYCYPDQNTSDNICACSMLLCDWNGTEEGCYKFQAADGSMTCLCKDSFRYSLYKQPQNKKRLCSSNEEDCRPPFGKIWEECLRFLFNL